MWVYEPWTHGSNHLAQSAGCNFDSTSAHKTHNSWSHPGLMSLNVIQYCASMDRHSNGDCYPVINYLYYTVWKAGGRAEACGHAVRTLRYLCGWIFNMSCHCLLYFANVNNVFPSLFQKQRKLPCLFFYLSFSFFLHISWFWSFSVTCWPVHQFSMLNIISSFLEGHRDCKKALFTS